MKSAAAVTRSVASTLLAAVAFSALAQGCSRGDSSNAPRPGQAALGTALPRPTEAPSSEEQAAERHRRAAEQPPAMRIEAGALSVRADDDHREAHADRTASGWAVSWGDHDNARMFLALADAQGALRGAPAMVRQAVSEEEEVHAPAVTATATGFALAWADPSNGRVRFARLDGARRPVGRGTIVHDGLESPSAPRIASRPESHGVAVQLAQGVYFARLSTDGARLGSGTLLAEDTPGAVLTDLRPGARGYEVSWREPGGAVRTATVSDDGQIAVRLVSDPSRVAAR
jgi:hypothetical protein